VLDGPLDVGDPDGQGTSGAPGTPRRRRRLVTAVGAIAAIGVGAALVAPNGDGATRPTVTSLGPSGASGGTAAAGGPTTAADAGEDRSSPAIGYLIDPDAAAAAGLVPVGGLSPSRPAADPPGRLRLWATQGASRTSGTWLAVQRVDETAPAAMQDAARVAIGDTDALVVVEPDGVVSLTVSTTDGGTAVLTAYGIAPTDLVDLAAELRATTAEGEAGVLSSRPAGAFGPLRLLLDRPSTGHGLAEDLLRSGLGATAFYRDVAGRIVSVTTAPHDTERDGVLAPFVLRGLGTDGSRDRIMSRGAVGLADHPALGAQHVVVFTDGRSTVRLSSTRSDVDLVALAAATEAGDDAQWRAVQSRGRGFVDGRGVGYTSAGTGTFTDGASWTFSFAQGPSWASFFVAEGDGTGTVAELYLDRAPCASVTTRSATTVACVRPTTGTATSLRVGTGGAAVAFEPVGGGWSIAVARVDERGPLPLAEVTDGRPGVMLGRTGGDVDGWSAWAALDPSAGDGPDDAADRTGWVPAQGIPGLTPLAAPAGPAPEPIGTLEIWGTSDASRTTGTWLAIATAAGGAAPPAAEAGIRVRIDVDRGGPIAAILQTAPDGVHSLSWSAIGGGAVTMVARGITPDRMLILAAGVRVDGRPASGLPTPLLATAPSADDGIALAELAHVPVTTLAAGYLGLLDSAAWTWFIDERAMVQVRLGVEPASPANDLAARLLTGPVDPRDPVIDETTRATLGPHVVIGSIHGEPAWRVLRMRIGDDVVTVLSRLPLATIAASLGELRRATAAEWTDLQAALATWRSTAATETRAIGESTDGASTDGASTDGASTDGASTDGASTDGGGRWSVHLLDVIGLTVVEDASGAWGLTLAPSSDDPIHVVRTVERTFVVALLPEAGAASALQVTIEGEEPLLVPLSASVTSASTWVGAAYAVAAADEATIRVELV
jgi:hypothetical protein